MRYPVDDRFAIRLTHGLYDRLLGKKRSLPDALQLALGDTRDTEDFYAPPVSRVTPVLCGQIAADLRLAPPPAPPDFTPQVTGLFKFRPEPERFVGRLLPMLRASQAFAPESPLRGVLFYGMAGAGKTHCALELAYRHERDRFTGYVWHEAPREGEDISTSLGDFLIDVESQLNAQDDALTAHVGDPENFKRRTLPLLKGLLESKAALIALDNIESLLTTSGGWRDPLWGDLVHALIDHNGLSRLILTSRRPPASLVDHPRLFRHPMHALSFPESVILARELPNLRSLFDSDDGRALLIRTLAAAQGHPKLLELADGNYQLLITSLPPDEGSGVRGFFTTGETALTADDFLAALDKWTRDIAATLPPAARLLLAFLCRLEDPDRTTPILEANWEDFLKRISPSSLPPLPPGEGPGVRAAPEALITSGLVESTPLPSPVGALPTGEGPGVRPDPGVRLRIHPAISSSILSSSDSALLTAADIELGNFHMAVFQRGLDTEMQGGGPLVVEGGKRAAPYLMRAERWKEAAGLLESVIQRDKTPATLALVLPRLQTIAAATAGTEHELIHAGILANALLTAGRIAEAERMERDRIAKCLAQGNYRLASVAAGQLLNLLRATGFFEEALTLAGQKADYTRRAGLGPWTQLLDEARRLQILNALGRYTEALSAVQRLRGQLTALPETGPAEETVNVWNVRETLLNIGCKATLFLEQWQTALDLNAEIVQFQQARGADAVEIARTRFNDYFPLLRLRRHAEARALLEYCRAAVEDAHDIPGLGKVFSALADLEYQEGHPPAAVRFAQTALRYTYQGGDLEDYAISHNNLAGYLERTGESAALVLAHRLAVAVIGLQISSGRLPTTINNLANSSLPAAAPSFAEVVAAVEQIEGVRFEALFASLQRRAPDEEGAIEAVLEMAKEEQKRREAENVKREEVIASLPPAVRTAIEVEDGEALKAALGELPEEEARAIVERLREAGVIR